MLSDAYLLEKIREVNKQGTLEDVNAFRRFMRCFNCEDSESYEEAHNRIDASMSIIEQEIRLCANDSEAHEILVKRYAKLAE